MFVEIQEKILAALSGAGFVTLDSYQGEVEDLLKTPQKLPSGHLIFSGCDFAEPKTIGGTEAPSDQIWALVIMSRNLRDRSSGNVESYTLIDTALTSLTRLNTGYGYLLPLKVELLSVKNGVAAYGFQFLLETIT